MKVVRIQYGYSYASMTIIIILALLNLKHIQSQKNHEMLPYFIKKLNYLILLFAGLVIAFQLVFDANSNNYFRIFAYSLIIGV